MRYADPATWVIIVAAIAIAIAIYLVNRESIKSDILRYLTAKGATNIKIQNNIFDNDRDTMTFYVDYTDRKGNRQYTSCKARTGLLSGGELFWSEITDSDPNAETPEPDRTGYDELSENIRSRSTTVLPSYQIIKTLSIMGSKDKLVLLDDREPFANLLRCHADGEIVWQAELLNAANDAYSDVEWQEGDLTAVNKSGIMVRLNLKTGKIVEGLD